MELELPITATVPAAHSEVTYTTAPDKTPVSMLVPQPSLLRAPSSDDDDDGDVDVDVDVDLDEADASADRVSTPRITLPASLQVAQLDSTNSSAPAPEKNASLSGLSVLPTLSRPQDLATTLSPVQVKGHPKSHTHRLVMRQHPRLSRSCGYGEKAERRPIDPPPVIQLEITSHEGSDHLHLYNPYYFMYASLIDCDTDEEVNILHDGKTRSMTGSIVSSLYRLRDLDNKEGSFFVFPDLSVRKEGTFKLKFSLFEICDTEMFFCASIVSNFFTVYSSKKFPGTEETTFLSKAFADQGIKIRVRKETRVRRNSFQDDLLDVNNAALVVRKRESLHESEEKDFRRDGSDWTAHIDKKQRNKSPSIQSGSSVSSQVHTERPMQRYSTVRQSRHVQQYMQQNHLQMPQPLPSQHHENVSKYFAPYNHPRSSANLPARFLPAYKLESFSNRPLPSGVISRPLEADRQQSFRAFGRPPLPPNYYDNEYGRLHGGPFISAGRYAPAGFAHSGPVPVATVPSEGRSFTQYTHLVQVQTTAATHGVAPENWGDGGYSCTPYWGRSLKSSDPGCSSSASTLSSSSFIGERGGAHGNWPRHANDPNWTDCGVYASSGQHPRRDGAHNIYGGHPQLASNGQYTGAIVGSIPVEVQNMRIMANGGAPPNIQHEQQQLQHHGQYSHLARLKQLPGSQSGVEAARAQGERGAEAEAGMREREAEVAEILGGGGGMGKWMGLPVAVAAGGGAERVAGLLPKLPSLTAVVGAARAWAE